MKFTKVNTDVERQFLIGLIASNSFAKKILPIFEYEYLDLSATQTVSKWCIEYHGKYSKAPQAVIQDIFNDKKKLLKEEDAKWIEEFLARISEEYSKQGFNEEYLFDSCVKYFKRQKLLKATEKVQDLLGRNKDDQAQQIWLDSMTIPEVDDLGIDPFDLGVVRRMFTRQESRASLGLGISSLDRMVGPVKSGWLAMCMGPMKRGKTFFLLHIAIRGLLKGYGVVFISLETEEEDNAERIWMNIGSLTKEKDKLIFPYFAEESDVRYRKVQRPELTEKNVIEEIKAFQRGVNPRFRIKTFPMGSAGMKEIRQYLDVLEVYENFSPHVIIVDYLGLLKAPPGSKGRDVYNENSMAMKALGHDRKAIMYSAHQGSRETLEKINMSPMDIPEDIRIFANVDALYGLLQTDREMDEGIMRINVLGHRHRKFTRRKQAKVLQQFSAGQFVLDDRIIDMPGLKEFKKKGNEK